VKSLFRVPAIRGRIVSMNHVILISAILLGFVSSIEAAPRRLLVADDSTQRLAIVAADGSLEWETRVGAIHDASVLPNGNILYQEGWNKIVEVTPDKKKVWEYDADSSNGNAGKRVEVHAFQRLDNGLTMIVESGTA